MISPVYVSLQDLRWMTPKYPHHAGCLDINLCKNRYVNIMACNQHLHSSSYIGGSAKTLYGGVGFARSLSIWWFGGSLFFWVAGLNSNSNSKTLILKDSSVKSI